jgi:signal transduction histidine kinase
MRQLYAGRGLDIELILDGPDLCFRGEEQDLQEMLGNLLDNACKWARRRVRVTARRDGPGRLAIQVDDDGGGIAEARRVSIFKRGERADERQPGSGLGLDIVRDLACTYGGRARADASDLGGLRVTLFLPAG